MVEQMDENHLVICTPNPFARSWLQKYYFQTIADVVKGILGREIEIEIKIAAGDDSTVMNQPPRISWVPQLATATPEFISSTLPMRNYKPAELNTKYLFSRFVVGSNNRMAHAAALAVAESPGREFNPLFLCGGVGLGKTHLMQAVGHYPIHYSLPTPLTPTS